MAQSKNQPTKDVIANVDTLVDLVEYQEGSMVRKPLVDNKVGSIILFAFAEGQGLGLGGHHLPLFDDLAYILDGEAEINVSDKLFQVKAGEIIVLPKNKIHTIKAIKRTKMLLMTIRA